MIDEQRQYLSYLLRLWQERTASPAVWRASLEDSHTGERMGFADIMQLLAFLKEQIAVEPQPQPKSTDNNNEPHN